MIQYRLIFVFLSFASHVLTAQSSQGQVCGQLGDEASRAACEQFHRALTEGHYITPAGASALDAYRQLEDAALPDDFMLALRIKLKGALQREVDQVLEAAAVLPMEEKTVLLSGGYRFSDYRTFARVLEELRNQGDAESEGRPWPLLYFTGLEQREKARRLQSKDTSLLMPALRMQLEALEFGQDVPHLHQEIAGLFFDLEKYDQSKDFYLQANKLAPEWTGPVMGLSHYLAEFDNVEDALVMAERAVNLQADFGETHLNAARLYARFERPQKSVEHYRKAIDRLLRDIESGPEAYRWYAVVRLAGLLTGFELYEQAEILLKKALAHRETPDAYLLLGEVYEYTNQTLSADSVYRRCISLWPDHLEAYKRAGALYQGLQRYALAKPFYEEAYVLNPLDREVCFNLGSIRHLYNFPAEAEILYQHALAYPDNFAAVFNKLDTIAATIDDSDEVKVSFLSAVDNPAAFFKANFVFSGPPVSAYEDYIYANLGDLYYAQGRLREAIAMYQRALLLNPGLPEVYKSIIQAAYDVKDYAKAFTYIQLYQLYVPYSRETRDDWKAMGKLSRELYKDRANRISEMQLNVYAFFMDNFWPYLYALNREIEGVSLERTMILRQQRPILQELRRVDLDEVLK